jgi:hypothetical protein
MDNNHYNNIPPENAEQDAALDDGSFQQPPTENVMVQTGAVTSGRSDQRIPQQVASVVYLYLVKYLLTLC